MRPDKTHGLSSRVIFHPLIEGGAISKHQSWLWGWISDIPYLRGVQISGDNVWKPASTRKEPRSAVVTLLIQSSAGRKRDCMPRKRSLSVNDPLSRRGDQLQRVKSHAAEEIHLHTVLWARSSVGVNQHNGAIFLSPVCATQIHTHAHTHRAF